MTCLLENWKRQSDGTYLVWITDLSGNLIGKPSIRPYMNLAFLEWPIFTDHTPLIKDIVIG